MQAYSPFLPVGAQHHYKSGFDALRTIYRAEGARGMIRGIDAAILRTGMGSSVGPPLTLGTARRAEILSDRRSFSAPISVLQVQLPSYYFTKNFLVDGGYSSATSAWTYLMSSTVSGICVCVRRLLPPPWVEWLQC